MTIFRLVERSVDGASIAFEYDDDGNPIKVGEAQLKINTDNPLLKSLNLGVLKTEYSWDNMGHIDKLVYKNGKDVVLSLDYTLNNDSQILSIVPPRPSTLLTIKKTIY